MASKCWFVLRHHHYPPPAISKSGLRQTGGPLRLGHIIPDLKHLDNVINSKNGPIQIPLDMPIYATKEWDLAWKIDHGRESNVSASVGVPLAAAAGITIKSDAGVAFQRSVHNFWSFESLDTYIIQATDEYVEDSLEDAEVATYLRKHRNIASPSVFMITGLIIARGAGVESSSKDGVEIHGGPGIEVPAIAEAAVEFGTKNETTISSAAKRVSDFIWAVRLAKISKQGLLDRSWSHKTFTTGATFGLNGEKDQEGAVLEILKREGLTGDLHFEIENDGPVFIIQ